MAKTLDYNYQGGVYTYMYIGPINLELALGKTPKIKSALYIQ